MVMVEHLAPGIDPVRWRCLLDLARRDAAAGAAADRLTDEVADALRASGALKALLPADLGGAGLDLPAACALVAELAEADGAAGWVLQIGAGPSWFAGWMPPDLAGELFGRPDAWVAGSGVPGRAVPVRLADGTPAWSVTGRWAWCSGAPWATAFTFATLDAEDRPGVVVVDRDQVQLDTDWSIRAMRASASWTATLDGATVAWSRRFEFGEPVRDEVLFRVPFLAFAEVSMASVSVGLGRALVREFVALAQHKVPFGATAVLADDPVAQRALGRAAATLRGAAERFEATVGALWESCTAGAPPDDVLTEVTLASLGAVDAGVAASRALSELAGTDALHPTDPFARVAADLGAVPCNAVVSPRRFGAAGAALLGRSAP